ncbi:16S rRNA processing protein RimM [Sphingobium wenxiniae]|uniref:Ribosome maturation factor RimM n=2 Tax=Sphingobium TaxID=165695 RepID=T0GRL6_9SPHN|nr:MULTISPECIES: ribosome maturation factor RimM [Sphingobium]EQB03297.1 ribosome maturation factor RimM [Sphingobium baderi LL03]KMS62581.1 ribosome maturation factor RimM [Sphingobium baderi LL03]MBB6190606.1 16S rRNA processing protein RimM [Sphingobium wenxiniae]TWH94384.1 16S rRNA processing protein RimM [Sphingobium wenxiniae]WRD76657.1 ribosome maturation factor RimM [Sphingobium baderi]
MTDKPVTLAVIIGAHGVAGEVRLKLFGEGAETLKGYKSFDVGGRVLTLKSVRPGPNGAVARFAEIGNRSDAESLRGTELTIPRSALPALDEGEYYHVDLIGLPCVSSEGEALGAIVAVENFGAGDIIEIERPGVEGKGGKRFMAPMHAVTLADGQAVIEAAFAA